MALIRRFVARPDARYAYRTEVECGYTVGEVGGEKILHLETYGSKQRAIPGKVSQSIELDRDAALELVQLIQKTFGESGSA